MAQVLRAAQSGALIVGSPGQALTCVGNGAGGDGALWEPGLGGALAKVGWDQPDEALTVLQALSLAQFRKSSAPTFLQVALGAVTSGQILEVDFRGTFGFSALPPADANLLLHVVVSFTASPTFPDDFFLVVDATTAVSQLENLPTTDERSCSARAAVSIPADAAQCFVQVGFTSSIQYFTYGGADGKNPNQSVLLKAALWNAAAVAQAGPGNLVSLAP